MNTPFNHELPETLAAAVRASNEVPEAAVQAAQARLQVRMAQARPARRPWLGRGLALAATASVVALAFLFSPLLPGGGDAFAATLERFRHFTSLDMRVVQHMNGQLIQTSHIRVDAAGRTRTDVGDQLSVIVDPARGRVLTLLHEPHEALLGVIPVSQATPGQGLDWLQALRQFKGKATPIAGSRVIQSQRAQGWSLDAGGQKLQLWANAQGLPLALTMGGASGLTIEYSFAFDAPGAVLSSDPPTGYRVMKNLQD